MTATIVAGALPLVGVAMLARHGTALAAWVDAATPVEAAVAVCFGGMLLASLALLPTHAVSLASGFALGALAGPIVAWAAVVAASLLGYSFGRVVAGDRLASSLRAMPTWAGVADALLDASPHRTAWLLALLRLSPLAPFAATNVVLAAMRTPLRPYLAGAALGLMPRVVAVALLGAGLSELDWSRPQTPWLLAAGGVATVVSFVLIGRVAGRVLRAERAKAAA